jgi:hypothetical protein
MDGSDATVMPNPIPAQSPLISAIFDYCPRPALTLIDPCGQKNSLNSPVASTETQPDVPGSLRARRGYSLSRWNDGIVAADVSPLIISLGGI